MIIHDNDNHDNENNYTIMITIKVTLIIKIMVNVTAAGLLYQPRSYGPTFFRFTLPQQNISDLARCIFFFWEGRSLSRVSVFGRSFQIQVATTTCTGIIFLCGSLLLKLVHIGSIQTVQQPSLASVWGCWKMEAFWNCQKRKKVVHKIAQDSDILFVTPACLRRPCSVGSVDSRKDAQDAGATLDRDWPRAGLALVPFSSFLPSNNQAVARKPHQPEP